MGCAAAPPAQGLRARPRTGTRLDG